MKNIPLSEIMTSDVRAISELRLVQDVLKIFKKENIHHLPIVDKEKKVIGIISRTDIDKITMGASLFKNRDIEEINSLILRTKWVSEIMTKGVVCLNSNDSFQEAYDIFKQNNFRAIPILTDGKLVGIVTPIDLVDYLVRSRV